MDTTKKLAYEKAQKRVEKLKGFYHHLMIYLIINIGLVGLNLYFDASYLWSLWCVFGWGIALVLKAISVFSLDIILGKKWEERKIKEYMEE